MRWNMIRVWSELGRRVHRARDEAENAQARLDRARQEVVQPLREVSQRNQFADLIRKSLIGEGRQR